MAVGLIRVVMVMLQVMVGMLLLVKMMLLLVVLMVKVGLLGLVMMLGLMMTVVGHRRREISGVRNLVAGELQRVEALVHLNAETLELLARVTLLVHGVGLLETGQWRWTETQNETSNRLITVIVLQSDHCNYNVIGLPR